jgi:hypothetical protein
MAQLKNLLIGMVLHSEQANTCEIASRIFPDIQFPPLLKNGRDFDVPDGIITHLTRECGGNVYEHQVVDVTSGSFEKETWESNPISGILGNKPDFAAKNAADLEAGSEFISDHRYPSEDIPHTRNHWLCYNFKQRRIVPTHYTIRTNDGGPGDEHLKSWLIEGSGIERTGGRWTAGRTTSSSTASRSLAHSQ